MNERLKMIRKEAGLTQSEFAKRIGLKGNYIYILESATKPMTDSVISNVCRVFGVREEWLRTGEEPMYLANSQSAAAIEWATGTLAGEDSFKKRFLEALSRLNEEDWELVERFIDSLTEKNPDTEVPG